MSEDDFDSAWERMSESAEEQSAPQPEPLENVPPIRVIIVIRAEKVPVAPWARDWTIAAAGPMDGLLTMQFDHQMDDSPVAQLAAITGLLSTIKSAKLDLVWWTIQTRGPFPGEDGGPASDLDQELSDLLGGE
jgi:hypothetical protein